MTSRNPARGGPGYAWMTARARNAVRRSGVFGTIAGVVFVFAIIAFVVVPRKASHTARTVVARVETKRDSMPATRVREAALAGIKAADSQLSVARGRASTVPLTAVDTFPPEIIARRETLTAVITRLDKLIGQAESAPLPSSYRMLAENPVVSTDPQAHAMLDSLTAIERDRTAYGALGATDPGYAALSARATQFGRSLTAIARSKRDQLAAELAPIRAPRPAMPVPTVFVDTMRFLSERAIAIARYAEAGSEIRAIRAQNQRVDTALEHARDLANLGAPPWAMLTAALVLAAALGFAGSLLIELRQPNIADPREAANVAGERVIAVIGPSTAVVERGRRQVDIDAPPLIDLVSEAYRSLYLHIASVGAGLPIVTVTGDEPEIVAAVASKLAAFAAYEARSTLLLDVDPSTCSVAAVLRVPPDPGLSGVLTGRATWAEAIRPTTIGRDRPLDVLPSGTRRTGLLEPHVIERVKAELERLQSRYDFIIVAAPTSYVQRRSASVIPSPDVLLTARLSRTTVTSLRSAAESLRGVNMKIQGLVLWNAPFPEVEAKRELSASRSEQ